MKLLEEDQALLERYHLFKNDLIVMYQTNNFKDKQYAEFTLQEIMRLSELIKRDAKL